MNKFIGQNEEYGVWVHWNEPYRESPHIVLVPLSYNYQYGEYEKNIESRYFYSINDTIKVSKEYLNIN